MKWIKTTMMAPYTKCNYLLPDPALEELGDVEDDGEESDGHDVGGQAPAVGARVAGHAAVLHRLVDRDVSDRGSI